jgi:pimeloyl-ACP methyl ester carboxylesterase
MRIRPPLRPRLRVISLGAVLLLLLSIAGATPALAGTFGNEHDSFPNDAVPDDQPLPPYTIVNNPLAPVLVNGEPSTVTQGTRAHAGFIIEVPPQWNGDLVMWAHGFRGQGTVLTVDPPAFALRQKFLDEGFAWAASSYAGNGYDVRTGVLTTKDLADFFAQSVHRPHRTYITGVSMGGHVIGRSLEQFPDYYEGALPMCGVMGDQFEFDYLADYNLVAQALSGVSVYPIPPDYLTNFVPQINAALGTTAVNLVNQEPANDLGKQWRAIVVNRSGGERPGTAAAFAFWKNALFSITTPARVATDDDTIAQAPGKISTNLLTRYQPNTPVDVNATVRRIQPEELLQRLSPFLTQIPKIQGRPDVPVLTLHGLGDLFVPFSHEQRYAIDAALHLQSRNVVQRAIRSINHCEFTPTEAGQAWDDLVNWVVNKQKPAGDNVLKDDVVADPNFGCTFSDPAAFAAGAGTRRLYPACPTA